MSTLKNTELIYHDGNRAGIPLKSLNTLSSGLIPLVRTIPTVRE
ncbi:MAG: hypothetical protein ACMUEM_01855 [Flavobacteriales bacterium AspAUS03]